MLNYNYIYHILTFYYIFFIQKNKILFRLMSYFDTNNNDEKKEN